MSVTSSFQGHHRKIILANKSQYFYLINPTSFKQVHRFSTVISLTFLTGLFNKQLRRIRRFAFHCKNFRYIMCQIRKYQRWRNDFSTLINRVHFSSETIWEPVHKDLCLLYAGLGYLHKAKTQQTFSFGPKLHICHLYFGTKICMTWVRKKVTPTKWQRYLPLFFELISRASAEIIIWGHIKFFHFYRYCVKFFHVKKNSVEV